MRWLGRLRGAKVPEWAAFFDGPEFERFVAAVEADAARRGWRITRVEDGMRVDGLDMEFGLSNLAQVCHANPGDAWPAIVSQHFDNLVGAAAGDLEPPTAFEEARALLKVRIYPSDQPMVSDGGVVSSPLAPGLARVLVFDLPTTVATVPRDRLADWPPVDELFAIATSNLRDEPAPSHEAVSLDSGGTIDVHMGDSFFVASRVLMLPEIADLDGARGALVAFPHRHALLVHPIRDLAAIEAINLMVVLADQWYREGPGSLSPTVHWWHDGALTPILSEVRDRKVSVYPPDALVEVLNGLEPPTPPVA
ncbi:MAG: hypothetical protein AB1627_03820 [Chloroflexota bacterium]